MDFLLIRRLAPNAKFLQQILKANGKDSDGTAPDRAKKMAEA